MPPHPKWPPGNCSVCAHYEALSPAVTSLVINDWVCVEWGTHTSYANVPFQSFQFVNGTHFPHHFPFPFHPPQHLTAYITINSFRLFVGLLLNVSASFLSNVAFLWYKWRRRLSTDAPGLCSLTQAVMYFRFFEDFEDFISS